MLHNTVNSLGSSESVGRSRLTSFFGFQSSSDDDSGVAFLKVSQYARRVFEVDYSSMALTQRILRFMLIVI